MDNIQKCGTCRCNKICDHNKYGFENCGNYISADVAPKSEVAREIFEEIEQIYDNRQTVCLSLSDFLRIKSKYIGE